MRTFLSFMDVLIQASQFLLSLSILIVLHEAGHMIPAKLFKTRVEKFYLFFDPYFSLVKKKIGGTEYGIGWIPLGGYVKISGMIDESMDKDQMKKPAEPWEFRAKPAWQRLIIMLGGIIVNVLVAFFIYSMILFAIGEEKLVNSSMKDGVWVQDSLAMDIGFQTGDKILKIGEEEIEYFNPGKIMEGMFYNQSVIIERDGEVKEIKLPNDLVNTMVSKKDVMPFFDVRYPFAVGDVPDTTNAYKAGIKKGDKIVSFNGAPIKYFDEIRDSLKQNINKSVSLDIERDGQVLSLNVDVTNDGTIGFMPAIPSQRDMFKKDMYEFDVKKYGFFEAFPAGVDKSMEVISSYAKQFALLLDFESGAYKGMGSFITFGKMFPPEWDWKIFWERTAFISIILAFMNLLPIPALDGGHVMFLLYEIVRGKPPGEKFMERAQMAGMLFLLALMVYALGNDIFRNFF